MILREAKRATLQRSADGRGNIRRELRLQTGGLAEEGVAEVLIHNLSTTGALIATTAELAVDDRIELDLPHAGQRAASVVWSDDGLYGCHFEEPLTRAAISAALLRSPAPPADTIDTAEAIDFDYDPEPEQQRDDRLHPAMRLLALTVFTLACWAVIFAIGLAIF